MMLEVVSAGWLVIVGILILRIGWGDFFWAHATGRYGEQMVGFTAVLAGFFRMILGGYLILIGLGTHLASALVVLVAAAIGGLGWVESKWWQDWQEIAWEQSRQKRKPKSKRKRASSSDVDYYEGEDGP